MNKPLIAMLISGFYFKIVVYVQRFMCIDIRVDICSIAVVYIFISFLHNLLLVLSLAFICFLTYL